VKNAAASFREIPMLMDHAQDRWNGLLSAGKLYKRFSQEQHLWGRWPNFMGFKCKKWYSSGKTKNKISRIDFTSRHHWEFAVGIRVRIFWGANVNKSFMWGLGEVFKQIWDWRNQMIWPQRDKELTRYRCVSILNLFNFSIIEIVRSSLYYERND
jgi:hypothetical protein